MKTFKLYFSMICLLSFFALAVAGCSDDDEKGVQRFTVTFDSQGGSRVESQTVVEGAKLKEPVAPAKEDAAFLGWFKEAACTNAWNFNTDVVTADITLYAGWRTSDYTVTFETNGGSEIAPQGVLRGALAKEPVPPVKAGMVFEGWYTDASLTQLYDFDTPVTADLTLYAKWMNEEAITRDALLALIRKAENLVEYNYELWSYEAVERARLKAGNILYNPQSTDGEIVEAYKNLSQALSQLVELPYRATAKIAVDNISADGTMLLIPGGYLALGARGVDNNGMTATNYEVVFDCGGIQSWVAGEIRKEEDYLYFDLKEDVLVGSTAELVIKSAEAPDVMSTVTLKVISHTEVVEQFKAKVNTLPDYKDITMDNVEELRPIIDELIWLEQLCQRFIGQDSPEYAEYREAQAKMADCETAADNITTYSYTFADDDCKLYDAYYDDLLYCTYRPDGNFPVGSYILKGWEQWEENDYVQYRLLLAADNTFRLESRHSATGDESNAGEWRLEDDKGIYKVTGSREQGGNLVLKYEYEDYSRSVLTKSREAKKLKKGRIKGE